MIKEVSLLTIFFTHFYLNAQLSLDISIEKTIDLQSVIDNLNDLEIDHTFNGSFSAKGSEGLIENPYFGTIKVQKTILTAIENIEASTGIFCLSIA